LISVFDLIHCTSISGEANRAAGTLRRGRIPVLGTFATSQERGSMSAFEQTGH
jgi:hypothetical protein